MRVDDPGDRDPAARELLDDHRVGRQVEPHPAVLLGDRHAEQPELLHLLDDRLRELVLVVVVLGVREDLLVGELADHLADRLLLVGLVGIMRVLRPSVRRSRVDWSRARENTGVNFARDVVDAAPAERLALVELARDGARREWTLRRGRRARRTAGRRAARARGRARRRRDDADRQPPGVGARRWSRAFASAPSCCRAPSSCAPRTCGCASSVAQPDADRRRRAQPRRARARAGWCRADVLWVPATSRYAADPPPPRRARPRATRA